MKEFLSTVTADGILVLPPEVSASFGKSAILVYGKDSSIAVYSVQQWRAGLERMHDNPAFVKAFRTLVGTAVEADISGGTLQFPPHLLQYSGICGQVRVLLSADSCLIVEPYNG